MTAQAACASNDYRKKLQPYFGVDRLPHLFLPDDYIRELIGVPPVTDPLERDILQEYFDARDDFHWLHSFNQAVALIRGLRGLGHDLELLICDLATTAAETDAQY